MPHQINDKTQMDISTETSTPAPLAVPPEIATVTSQDGQYAGASPFKSIDVTSSAAPDHITDENIVPQRHSTQERHPPQHLTTNYGHLMDILTQCHYHCSYKL